MSVQAFLLDFVLLFGVSIPAVYFLRRAGIPSVVGYLAVGVLIGPGGLGWIGEREIIEALAKIGVVLLLFVVGMKLPLRELARMRAVLLGPGLSQVILTACAGAGIAAWWGMTAPHAIFAGLLLSLSSTALSLKLLEERGRIESPEGTLSLGILLLQDLAVIPMMLAVPLLAGASAVSWKDAVLAAAESLFLLGLILVVARLVIPPLLARVVRARSREIFTLTVILIAMGTAYLAGLAGVSLALGSFLAGMVVSESEYAYQALSETMPFRDVFDAVFFVSMGMLVEPAIWLAHPAISLGSAAAVLVVKGILILGVALAFGYGIGLAVLAGLGLSQVGEFSFILAAAGLEVGLMGPAAHRWFISASFLSMALTPFLVRIAPALAERASAAARLPGLAFLRRRREEQENGAGAGDHVVIVGYGAGGRAVARLLRELGVEFLIMELNPFTVRTLRREGERVHYGDATRREAMSRAGVDRARALVISVPDPPSCRQIVALARQLNPSLAILARTRFLEERDVLRQLGADEVVIDEQEASLALASRLMALFGMEAAEIERRFAALRREGDDLLREEPASGPE